MLENDLKNIWNKSGKEADSYFRKIEPELEKKAHSSSKDVMAKVKRNLNAEIILTIIFLIALPFIWKEILEPIKLSILLILVAFSFAFYFRFIGKLRKVRDENVMDSLKDKIDLLSSFIRRLKIFVYILTPAGFYYGYILKFLEDGDLSDIRIIDIAITLPIIALLIWLINAKYIYFLYGKNLKELKNIFEGLLKD